MKKWLIFLLCLMLLLSGCKMKKPNSDETAEVITDGDKKAPVDEVEAPDEPEVVTPDEPEVVTPDEPPSPDEADTPDETPVSDDEKQEGYPPVQETDQPVNRRENGDMSFNGKDAYIVGYTGDYVVLRPQGFSSYDYIQVMTDTTKRNIIINEMVYMKGHAIKLETPLPFPSDEPRVPIAFKAQDGFEMTYKFDPDNIADDYDILYIGDGFGIFKDEKHYVRVNVDLSEYCVGDVLYFEGKAEPVADEKYTVDGKEITVDYVMSEANVAPPHPFIIAKPVIYLYPEEETEVTVRVEVDGELTCVYPAYDGKWQVRASPDGTLTDKKGREYYCLYWEADMFDSILPDKTHGFVVSGEDTAEFLREKALMLGLSEKEANEFIIYWLPQMEDNAYNYVYFSTDEYKNAATLDITPHADTVIRFAMMWQPLEKPIEVKEQILPKTPKRHGFTVVEWGGSCIR